MRIAGIDNGLDGGLVVLDGTEVAGLYPMPTVGLTASKRAYDAVAIVACLRGWKLDHVVLERAQAMMRGGRQQGTVSSFSIGYGAGLIAGIVGALGLPHTVVMPQAWGRVMFAGLPREKGDTKRLSAIMSARLWPGVDWKRTPKCKGPHSGLTDAAMLAEYGRRTLAR